MATTNVSFRMDADLKSDFEKICNDMGMNLTTAFTIFAKQVLREHGLPFRVSADPFYSANNQAALQKSMTQLQQKNVVTKTLEELQAMEDG